MYSNTAEREGGREGGGREGGREGRGRERGGREGEGEINNKLLYTQITGETMGHVILVCGHVMSCDLTHD